MPRRAVASLLVLAGILTCSLGAASPSTAASVRPPSASATSADWRWPVFPFRLVAPYVQPAHRYAPGHRGVDLLPLDGRTVRAPADGVVAFAGRVADRDLLTIDHGEGFVATLEPVTSDLAPGTIVLRGEIVGEIASGGHASPGSLHFGVRLAGEYINPLALYGGVPRAVLLPCCD